MLRKLFLKLNQNKPQMPKRIYEGAISDFYYERAVKDLVGSKYCEIDLNEEDFIKHLLYKLNQNNLNKLVKLNRMSNKTISFSYNSYPVGKIKLQGRKTWMQILTSPYDQERIEDASNHEYIEAIESWIDFIKKQKLNR
ncbi:hypothetical protein H9635_10035 [Solibacillus sp. A46]|uniref:Uncharacterized protein n=1 Tax=Solibacillus faecavium TaxID=2762221 RepID=A0ABR8XYR0_9BACL|nr:hypothetical protein [Solibacillus faecavium]MBD8037084.1 hypothetical protein [Solibacillus faecavium]